MTDRADLSNPLEKSAHVCPMAPRVPVQTLFEYSEGGDTLEDFLEGFPTVSRALALQALVEAKHLLLTRV